MKIKPLDSTTWYQQNGDNTYRVNYNLNNNSIVVDIGARHGNWSDIIRQKYNSKIFCFEAVDMFCEQLREKGYEVFNKAVTDKSGTISLGIFENEASILYDKTDTNQIISCDCIPATDIFKLINYDYIDLMKINVEGAEYSILSNLIDNNLIHKIGSLQIQFHILENSDDLYLKIVNELEKTHKITWRFPFIWENWQLK